MGYRIDRIEEFRGYLYSGERYSSKWINERPEIGQIYKVYKNIGNN